MVSEILKVIFVNRFFHPDISATSQLVSGLAFHLAAHAHEVVTISSRQLYQHPRAGLPRLETINGVNVVRVTSSSFGRDRLVGRAIDYLTFYISAGAALWRLAKPGVTVVAKTDPPLISVIAALVCRIRGARLVNWLQDLFPEVAIAADTRFIRGWVGRMLAWWRDRSLHQAKCNVALGDRMGRYIENRITDRTRLTVIPNWVDGRSVAPVETQQNPLRREWQLAGMFVIGYSGNMGRVHEFETILAAAKQLTAFSDIRFLFIGHGRWRRWIEETARREQLHNVDFKPYQPNERLALSLGAADVHLVSLQPRMEGFVVPSKFYGIAAAGRPTIFIGDRDGEIARVLGRHNIGITVTPGDVQGLVSAITELKTQPDKARAMGTRARAVFEAEYDEPIAMAKWEAVLAAVAEGRPAGFTSTV